MSEAIKTMIEWKLDDIISWCAANNELDWLEAESAKTMPHKVYPKVASVSASGKKSWKADKTQEPTIVEQPISFAELRYNFYHKFINTEPPKGKELTMQERIAIAIAAAKKGE